MNTSEDGDEPMGENPGLWTASVGKSIDPKAQAIKEIRHMVDLVLCKPMSTTGYVNTLRSGEKACAAEIRAILDRLGV